MAWRWVVVLAAVGLALWAGGGSDRLVGGAQFRSSLKARSGVGIVWGTITVSNPGKRSVTLRAARLVKPKGLHVRRVMAAGPDRGYPLFPVFELPNVRDERNSFHPDRWKPLGGFQVRPASTLTRANHDDVQIIFEFEPMRPGQYEAVGAEIDYDAGGDTQTLLVEDAVYICAPRGCKPGGDF